MSTAPRDASLVWRGGRAVLSEIPVEVFTCFVMKFLIDSSPFGDKKNLETVKAARLLSTLLASALLSFPARQSKHKCERERLIGGFMTRFVLRLNKQKPDWEDSAARFAAPLDYMQWPRESHEVKHPMNGHERILICFIGDFSVEEIQKAMDIIGPVPDCVIRVENNNTGRLSLTPDATSCFHNAAALRLWHCPLKEGMQAVDAPVQRRLLRAKQGAKGAAEEEAVVEAPAAPAPAAQQLVHSAVADTAGAVATRTDSDAVTSLDVFDAFQIGHVDLRSAIASPLGTALSLLNVRVLRLKGMPTEIILNWAALLLLTKLEELWIGVVYSEGRTPPLGLFAGDAGDALPLKYLTFEEITEKALECLIGRKREIPLLRLRACSHKTSLEVLKELKIGTLRVEASPRKCLERWTSEVAPHRITFSQY